MNTHANVFTSGSTRRHGVHLRDAAVVQRPASITQHFFERGEEQEASGYRGVVLDSDDAITPTVAFDTFDAVPRRRGPLAAVVAVTLLVGGLLVARRWLVPTAFAPSWRADFASMLASARAGAQPRPAPGPAPAAAPAPAPAPKVATTPQETTRVDDPRTKPEPAAAEAPRRADDDDGTDEADAADAADQATATAKAKPTRPPRRSPPLRGMVWSPAAGALVPADRAASPAPIDRDTANESDQAPAETELP